MPTYICEKCGCIDNSACGGNYWGVKCNLQSFSDEYSNTRLLCTICVTKLYKDCGINQDAGTCHKFFPDSIGVA